MDGKQDVEIKGTEVDPTSGNLNMTTVSVRDGLNIFEAFGYWLSGRYGLVPREEVYPAEKTRDQVKEENTQEMQQSESSAELAALQLPEPAGRGRGVRRVGGRPARARCAGRPTADGQR